MSAILTASRVKTLGDKTMAATAQTVCTAAEWEALEQQGVFGVTRVIFNCPSTNSASAYVGTSTAQHDAIAPGGRLVRHISNPRALYASGTASDVLYVDVEY